jgi:hypothetical protein
MLCRFPDQEDAPSSCRAGKARVEPIQNRDEDTVLARNGEMKRQMVPSELQHPRIFSEGVPRMET